MIQGLALQLGQIAEKGLVSGEAPSRESAAAEDPVAEASEEPAAERLTRSRAEEAAERTTDDEIRTRKRSSD